MGCINVNYVTPTHVTPHIMEAILIARRKGLRVPTVYNCGGYESVETLRLLEGFVDIYMPDAKFADPDAADELCKARDYPEVMKAAIKEMHRQVGDLVVEKGVARRGLLVRHLVMPNDVCRSLEVMDFLAGEVSPNTFVNVMDQYRPIFKAREHPKIARSITGEEFSRVHLHARNKGLRLAD
jgi:putative pyruvate formate lyase activating enzyme